MRERFFTGGLSGGGMLVMTLLSIARMKLFALTLGASGLGLVSQVIALQSAVLALLPLFSGPPLLAALAVARRKGMLQRSELVAAARGMGVLVAGLPTLAVIMMALAQGGDLATLIALGALGIPFGALLAVEQTALQESQRFTWLILTNVLGATIGLAATVILTLQQGIVGAAIGTAATMMIAWTVSFVAISRPKPLVRADMSQWAAIGRTGSASLLASVFGTVGFAALRPIALASLGTLGAGIVYALAGLSLQMSLFVATALTTYAAPRVTAAAAAGQVREVRQEIWTIQLLGLVGSGCLFLLMSAISGPLVSVLLSDDFAAVAILLPLQLAGELLLIHAWLTGTYLVPLGHRRMVVAIPAMIAIPRLVLSPLLVPIVGVAAFPLAHLVASALAVAVMEFHAKRAIGLSSRVPLLLVLIGATGMLAAPVSAVFPVIAATALVLTGLGGHMSRSSPPGPPATPNLPSRP